MTSLKITNFDRLDANTIHDLLHPYLDQMQLDQLQYEQDYIRIPHPEPEPLENLEWTRLGTHTETYVIHPTPETTFTKAFQRT
jgi:hypothetical protein